MTNSTHLKAKSKKKKEEKKNFLILFKKIKKN